MGVDARSKPKMFSPVCIASGTVCIKIRFMSLMPSTGQGDYSANKHNNKNGYLCVTTTIAVINNSSFVNVGMIK